MFLVSVFKPANYYELWLLCTSYSESTVPASRYRALVSYWQLQGFRLLQSVVMCVQGVWEKRPADIHTVMSNFAKLNSSWLVQSIRKVLRMVSVILVNVLIVSPLNKNFENAKHVLFDQKNKRRHFKGVKEARKEGALGLQILSQEDISCHRKTFPFTERNFLSQEEISCQRKKFHLKRQNFKL